MKKQRIVVKVGTSVLTNETAHLNRQRMLELVRDLASVRSNGHEVVLVTSGAQGAGREVLNYPDMTKTVTSKQLLCAVGQSRLMRIYGDLFDIFQLVVGQILLTRDDLSHRTRYLNARDTMLNLLEFGVIPIVNENDTTATHELRVGDNDNLSALIANLIYHTTLYCVITILFFVLGYVAVFARMVRHHWCSPIGFLTLKPRRE